MTASRLVIPDLAGKAVLITGGSTGIGAAVARGFAEQGAIVAIGYHSSEKQAQTLTSEIKAAGGEALAVKGDVADPKACERIVADTTARFGRLDGLINNAGLMLGRVHSLEAGMSSVAKCPNIPKWSVAFSGAIESAGTLSPLPMASAMSRNGTPSSCTA